MSAEGTKHLDSGKDEIADVTRQTSSQHEWIDKLTRKIGNPGRYQACMFWLLAVNWFPITINYVIMSVYGWKFSHICDPYAGNYTMFQNATLNGCVAVLFDFNVDNQTVKCTEGQWRYTKEDDENTIVTQYDLVCDKEDLTNLATTVFFLGVLLGGPSLGYIADRYGRKPTFAVCVFAPVLLGVASIFSPVFSVFAAIRFAIGFFYQGLHTSMITLYTEMLQPKHRGYAGALVGLLWGIAELVVTGLAYAFYDWKHIQLAVSLPSLVVLTYIVFIPESYRWLLSKGRTEEAEQIIRRLSRFNKIEFPENIWEGVKSALLRTENTKEETANRKYSHLDLLKTPEMRKRTLITCLVWFTTMAGFYSLMVQISTLPGDKRMNLFFSSLFSFIGGCLCIPLISLFSRRKCLIFSCLISGAACILTGVLPDDNDGAVNFRTMKIALGIAGKCVYLVSITVIILFTQEIFPTVIRTMAFGIAATFGRLGGVVAPQIVTLGLYTYEGIPNILFGSLSLIVCALIWSLPETRSKTLPDTIEDIEDSKKVEGKENPGFINVQEMNKLPSDST